MGNVNRFMVDEPALERAVPAEHDAGGRRGPALPAVALTVVVCEDGQAILNGHVQQELVPTILRDVAEQLEARMVAGTPATSTDEVTE